MDLKQFTNKNTFISNPSNLFYLSGLNNPDAYILIINGEKYYFTDDRYMENAKNKLSDFRILHIKGFFDFLKTIKISDLFVENDIPYFFCKKLSENGINHFYKISDQILNERAAKNNYEIEKIKKAQSITDKTFKIILSKLRESITEKELASELEGLLFYNGAEDLAFKSIVAFDKNTSIPHAERTDRKLKFGSIITLDFGAKYGNYCSDMTRTLFFGKASQEQTEIYNKVLNAQNLAIEKAKVGMTGKDLDEIARNYFAKQNLSDFFKHSLGHGVGIDIHEFPRASKTSDDILTYGNVVTVEPGLYFEGKFGIRIEDMIYFDKDGVINLTKSPKNIIIV